MDKKLLLTVQYECNNAGLGIPWDKVGITMGDEITGGAVVQHMAKLRARMVEQGLDVPPPLRRGGGSSRISTSKTSSGTKVKATPTKIVKKSNPSATKSKLRKTNKAGKKPSGSEDSDDSDDDNDDKASNNDDSDGEYGGPRAKRAKTHAKGPMRRKVKTEDSDEEMDTPTKASQRKPYGLKASAHDRSAYGDTDIHGNPIDYGSDNDDDVKDDRVGAGEPWLFLDNENATEAPKKKSLVVSLPTTPVKPNMVGAVQEEEDGHMSEYEGKEEVFGGEVASQKAENDQLFDDHVQLFSDLDQSFNAGPQNALFNEGYQGYQSFGDVYAPTHDSIGFQASGGENDFVQENTTEQFGEVQDYQGQNSEFDQMSMTFNHYNTDDYTNLNGGDYQVGSVSNGVAGGLPYLQTSWPSSYGATGVISNDTSVNQTPAGPSASTDFRAGYFSNNDFNFDSFDSAGIDFSADDGADTFFDADNVDGNFVGGGMYGSGYYAN